MVVRRRYAVKRPKGYKLGGAVIPDDDVLPTNDRAAVADVPTPPDHVAAEMSTPVDTPAPSPIRSEDNDAVARAVAAQQRAEELQRQAHRAQLHQANIGELQAHHDAKGLEAEAQQIGSLPPPSPVLSERRKDFIRANPELVDPENEQLVTALWRRGLKLGLQEDTEAIDQFVVNGLRSAAPPSQASQAPPQAREEPVQRQSAPMADDRLHAPAPSPEPRRSMPMTAPPTREVPTSNGSRRSSDMTLTAEERQIARAAIIDRPDMPALTDAEKEFLYLQNRNRYRAMVRDGLYSEQKG